LKKQNSVWSITKKERGIITLTFLAIVLIFTTVSFIIYIYYGFQKFYIKRTVKNSLKEIISKNIIYDYQEEIWYFDNEIEKIEIEYVNANEEVEMYISEVIKNEFVNQFSSENNSLTNNGMIKNLGVEEKYINSGQVISDNGLNVETENSISAKVEIEKIDYAVDENNLEIIDDIRDSRDLQILDSALKVKIKVRIKSAYPMFLFTSNIIGDKFISSNGREIKRAYYDILYIVSI
jgi:hypothetical protein